MLHIATRYLLHSLPTLSVLTSNQLLRCNALSMVLFLSCTLAANEILIEENVYSFQVLSRSEVIDKRIIK